MESICRAPVEQLGRGDRPTALNRELPEMAELVFDFLALVFGGNTCVECAPELRYCDGSQVCLPSRWNW